MEEDYKTEMFIQTSPHTGKKRIVIYLYKTTKKLVKEYYIDINEDEFLTE